MGCFPSESGVTVKFLNKDGSPDPSKSPIFGKACKFYSKQRPVDPNSSDLKYGSKDWFTDVLIASDREKLGNLPHDNNSEAFSSGSSRQVCLRWNTTDVSGAGSTGASCDLITIALGVPKPDPLSESRPRLQVEQLFVMPADTKIVEGHPLWDLWNQMALYFLPVSGSPLGTNK